ncbi:hypothetical protein GZL_05570 [Streptomyces sp. 769]|nr:hypothetical protein GZL_05570 [Streptomyces sp. 769]
MFVEADTAVWSVSLVHRGASRSKCDVSTPSFLIRSLTYFRFELRGSTPNFTNASDNVRDDDAAASRRSRVYGLTGMLPPWCRRTRPPGPPRARSRCSN